MSKIILFFFAALSFGACARTQANLSMVFGNRKSKTLNKFSRREKILIRQGKFKAGMSRQALYTAIGYPPASLNSSFDSNVIVYEKKRFNKTQFNFGRDGKLKNWQD